ncbi:MAG TPA: DUF899 family protein [Chthonomonadaceae bacterium]|nr:DUF899 family protein [Chthonomonadaceae bacterium]
MDEEIKAIEQKIMALKEERTALWRKRAPEPVKDYSFRTADGAVTLSSLFGDRDDLLIVHNMGAGCAYCTLWADGLNGLLHHLQSRAAFTVCSPDTPETQAKFASGRGWKFRMVSEDGPEFTKDMGFLVDEGHWPGVSAFRRAADGSITRTGWSFFGPGDDYCSVWPLFDMLDKGADGWEPKYRYE